MDTLCISCQSCGWEQILTEGMLAYWVFCFLVDKKHESFVWDIADGVILWSCSVGPYQCVIMGNGGDWDNVLYCMDFVNKVDDLTWNHWCLLTSFLSQTVLMESWNEVQFVEKLPGFLLIVFFFLVKVVFLGSKHLSWPRVLFENAGMYWQSGWIRVNDGIKSVQDGY